MEAADIANIYELTPDELLITLTLANCTDDALKQELIKHEANSMKEIQDKVNKWETRMNTASRMHSENNSARNRHGSNLKIYVDSVKKKRKPSII